MADERSDVTKTIASAQPGQGVVIHNGKEYETVKEGLAYILTPKGAVAAKDPIQGMDVDSHSQLVFYNPIQQFNRDLSVLAIRAFGED
ncbi:MAG: RNA methyltransferase tRNA(m5U54)methyltransferase, partial [Pleopsidium flavum]